MRLLTITFLLSYAPNVLACSFAPTFELFEPEIASFESKFDENNFVALLPAPISVEVKSIVRGTAAPGSSCGDAGILHIEVSWPEDSVYRLEEIGFYFRTDPEKLPDYIFPLVPVAPLNIDGGNAVFMFVWLDGHPSQQEPLDFSLEVFAVNKGMEIGLAKTIQVSY